jgi:hypothetical protein
MPGQQRAGADADLARGLPSEHVQPEDDVDLRVVEHALRDHQLRAGRLLFDRDAFLRGLEQEDDLARELRAHADQRFRRDEQHRGVRVVSASVHDADGAAFVRARGLARERQVDLLAHGQRVHVGAQRDHGARSAALDHGDDAVLRDAGARRQAHRAQLFGDEARGLDLAVRQLRVLVQVSAPLDEARRRGLDARVDVLGQRGWPRLRRHGASSGYVRRSERDQRDAARGEDEAGSGGRRGG